MDPVNVSRKGRRRKGDVEGNAKAGERCVKLVKIVMFPDVLTGGIG